MLALLDRLTAPLRRVTLQAKPLPEPEPLRPAARPMTGFLATLTEEQRAAAVAYCGNDHLGERR
jgi:hypothetical protein